MLKKLGFLKNSLVDLEYYEKLRANRKVHFPIKQKLTQNIQTSKDEMSHICNNTIQSKFSNIKNKNKYNQYSFNSYQYMKQKALIFVNKNNNKSKFKNSIGGNANTTIKKLDDLNQNISPIKKDNKKILLASPFCPNDSNKIKNRNKNKERKRNLSVCFEKNKNYDNNKTIKEIRIKSNKKISQLFSYNNKNNIYNNEDKIMTISNINNIENNNDYKRNKRYLETPRVIIYSKKTLKPYKSLSMERKPSNTRNTIKSIEIDFGHKIYGNYYTDKKCLNTFKIAKIIMIQRYFRKFLEIKNLKMLQEKVLKGTHHLKKYMLFHISESVKIFFLLYKYKLSIRNHKGHFLVNKDQYDLLKILKEKNISGMMNFKKYILKILNNNKLELF